MTLAQDITRHYRGDWHGSWGAFPSPGHSSDDRGVTVRDAEGGGDVVFHSFNGADWREIKDECRRIGLLPEFQRANDNQRREAGIYEYANADGEVLYRTVRIEQPGKRKRFEAQRPDGRGGWQNGLGDVARVLYRLPDIEAAKRVGKPIVILVEGERKADKLTTWGYIATSCAFGCKGWRKSYADVLAGCVVVILPDNDDEGRAFAGKAAVDIERAGGEPRIVELPGLPPKGDIIDWTGSPADFDALINPPAKTFPLADLAAWERSDPKPKPFLMTGFIPSRELTLATGAGGANKSTFGQQLATCVAAGLPMLGVDVMQGNALYITAEDDEDRLHWMQAHICKAVGASLSGLSGKLHLASLRGRLGNEIATFDLEGKLRPSASFSILRATIERTGARLVVLDNAAHLFAGNENDRQQVTAFVNLLYSLCQDLGATVVLVAHSNKAGDTYSGSTAWLNAVRSQIVLSRPDDTHDPDERILSLGKANYARQGQELRFRWHDFALRLDSDLPTDTRKELAATVQASNDNELFIACLREMTKQQRAVSEKPSKGFAPLVFTRMPESRGIGKPRLEAAMDRLYRIGRIERGELWRGPDRKTIYGLRETPGWGAGNVAGNGAQTLCGNAGNGAASA